MSAQTVTTSRPTRRGRLAVLISVLACAALTSFAGPARAATPTETTAAQNTYRMLNSERAAHYLPALGWSTALVSSAHRHNLAMAAANTLSHQLPGEPVFTTRISQAGVNWHAAAENIGWTTDRSSAGSMSLETAMYNEKAPNDGHRLNILSTSVRYVGIDTYIDAATGKLWLTEDFADVAGPQASAAPAAGASHQPVGNLDSVTVLPRHGVRLNGWAVDPDYRYTHVTIGVYCDGRFVGWYRSPTERLDVARALHAGNTQGYSIVLALPAGRHTLTTIAWNLGAGSGATTLGSRSVVA